MSADKDVAIPAEIKTPGQFAAWFKKKLDALAINLPDDEAEKIKRESIDAITQITLKWADPLRHKEAEKDFRQYYRQVETAIEIHSDLEETRDLAATESNPTLVGNVGKFVSELNFTKTTILSGLLGGIGFRRIAKGIEGLRNLEMIVTELSGKSGVFKTIGGLIGNVDKKLVALGVEEEMKEQAGDVIDKAKGMLPGPLTDMLQKFVKPHNPKEAEQDIPVVARPPRDNSRF